MLSKLLHFLKYNNAVIIILAIILILGGGALAAGPEAIGGKETSIQGVDNAALLSADLDNLNLDFKIERIEQDDQYYYVTYSFLDLNLADSLWQYQLSQKTRKVSKKIKDDLGLYLAKFLAKHYEARLRELKQEKERAQSQGEQKRIEVTEYSGLIGQTLNLAAKVFPGYEPVKKVELPTPDFTLENPPSPSRDKPWTMLYQGGTNQVAASGVDNLTKIYNDYVAEHPEVFNPPAYAEASAGKPNPPASGAGQALYQGGTNDGQASTTPAAPEILEGGPEQSEIAASSTPEQTGAAEPTPAPAETPAIAKPEKVEVIELPTPSPTPLSETAPTPAPVATPAE